MSLTKLGTFFNSFNTGLREKGNTKNIHIGSEFTQQKDLKDGFDLLEKQLKEKIGDKKLVIFIDDLDRCESEHIIDLLSAIKLFFTYAKNIIFVAGIDKDAITKGLQAKYNNDKEKAEEYLEKIFTINFSMPKSIDVSNLVSTYFEGETATEVSAMFNAIGFKNPRHIKKLLNKYKVLKTNIIEEFKKNNIRPNEIILLVLFLYLAYLYEFKFKEFDEIKPKDYNRKKYGKRDSDNKAISIDRHEGSLWLFLTYFIESFDKETILSNSVINSFDFNNQNLIENIYYFGKNKEFILFMLKYKDEELVKNRDNVYKIKNIIQTIW